MVALLQVSNLQTYYFSFGGGRVVKAVDDVSFTLEAGETIGLVGESGCGKTTTCLSILGLVPSAARIVGGSIEFAGEDLTRKRPREIHCMKRNVSRLCEKHQAMITRITKFPSAAEPATM